jgi:hypothetical protein
MVQVAKHKAKSPKAGDTRRRKDSARTSQSQTAGKLASGIEAHMSDVGFTEREKDERVSSFAERVNGAIARRAKS